MVTKDIALACELATEGGVLVFDDFANIGHPGVAAALWPAIMERDLKPFASSPSKLYVALGGDWAGRYRGAIQEFAAEHGYRWKPTELPGSSIVIVWPINDRKSLGARVTGRMRRSIRRTLARFRLLPLPWVVGLPDLTLGV
jgi:hypothetical protein